MGRMFGTRSNIFAVDNEPRHVEVRRRRRNLRGEPLLSRVEQMAMDMMFTASCSKQGKDEEKYKQQGFGRCSYPELKPRRILQHRKSPPPQSNQIDSFAYIYTFDPTSFFLECTQLIYHFGASLLSCTLAIERLLLIVIRLRSSLDGHILPLFFISSGEMPSRDG